jgi:hypothetical protein
MQQMQQTWVVHVLIANVEQETLVRFFLLTLGVHAPERLNSNGSVCVSVCLSIFLSVYVLPRNLLVCTSKTRYHVVFSRF